MSRPFVPRRRAPVAAGVALGAVALLLAPAGATRFAPGSPADAIGNAVGDRVAGVERVGAGADPGTGAGEGTFRPPAPLLVRLGETASAPDPSTLSGYRWPLARGRLTLPFKPIPGGTFTRGGHPLHDGIDVASFCGDRVVAAHDGVVLAAGRHFDDLLGWQGDLGPYYAHLDEKKMWNALPIALVVDDGNGYRSVYAHFERVVVKVGQRVTAGELVGYEGRTGHASGCHVHYGLFSPAETARFGVRPDVRKRLRTPPFEIARIDPLLVLPDAAAALRTRHFAEPPAPGSGAGPAVAAGDEGVRGEAAERLG